jgi:hypothetical protein
MARNHRQHLALALSGGVAEQRQVIGVREVRTEQPNAREVEITPGQHVENDGMLPSHAGSLDPVVRLVFGQVQHLDAIDEERVEAGGQVQPAALELDEVTDQAGGRLAGRPGQRRDRRGQIAVGQQRRILRLF